MGSDALERGCRKTIPDVDLSAESLSKAKAVSSAIVLLARSATPFILLWSIPSSMAPVDAAFICEFDKCIGHVFPSLVILELLHLCLEVVLCKCLVGSECIKCITFLFELHCSTVGCCIVNVGHPLVLVQLDVLSAIHQEVVKRAVCDEEVLEHVVVGSNPRLVNSFPLRHIGYL